MERLFGNLGNDESLLQELRRVAGNRRWMKQHEVYAVEAMKMVSTLLSPGAGRVEAVRCSLGDGVVEGELLVLITPEEQE